MNIRLAEIPKGHPNRPGGSLDCVKALVFHYTANDSPEMDAAHTAQWFRRPYIRLSTGEIKEKDGSVFKHGSAHFIFDMFTGYECIPESEPAYHAGWNKSLIGQQETNLAKTFFCSRQNMQTLGIEICNNDVIPGDNKDWEQACNNAIEWAREWLVWNERKVNIEYSLNPQVPLIILHPNDILILRHYDLTQKICPKPFVDDPAGWQMFIKKIAS